MLRGKNSNKKVYLLHPEDGNHFDSLEVNKEYDVGLQCNPKHGIAYKIYKHGAAWIGEKGEMFWLAVSGTPFTNYVIPEYPDKPLSVPEFVAHCWGHEIYNNLDEPLKKALYENHAITVTVEPVEMPQDFGISALKAREVLQDHNRKVFEDFATSEETPDKMGNLINDIIKIALGAFFMYFVVKQGII